MPFCCIPEIGAVRSMSASHAAHPDAAAGFRFQKSPPENREAKKKSREDSVLVFRRGFGGLGGAGRLLHAGVRTRKHGSG